MIVEAKGEGQNPRTIYRSFMVVLGQILCRMQNEDSRFVIALPAQEGFVRLARMLPAALRQKLNLEIWVINPDNVGYQLAILHHNVA